MIDNEQLAPMLEDISGWCSQKTEPVAGRKSRWLSANTEKEIGAATLQIERAQGDDMPRVTRIASWLLATTMVWSIGTGELGMAAPSSTDRLVEEFLNPPDSARPRTWWHWMNGNVTEDGIRKDLEWMKRAGLGGLQMFDANIVTPQIVDSRAVYMTPAWKAAFKVAASEANRLGLELAIASSPGWSETGGPWVKPEDGLKKVVWSEIVVEAGDAQPIRLPAPPANAGPFQSMPYVGGIAAITGNPPFPAPSLYHDIAVFAVPFEAGLPPPPEFRAGGPEGSVLDATLLADSDFATGVEMPAAVGDDAPVVSINYEEPQTIRSVTLHVANATPLLSTPTIAPVLEVLDGTTWRAIAQVPLGTVPTTVSFSAVTGNRFQIRFLPKAPKPVQLGTPAPGVDFSVLAVFGGRPSKPLIAELLIGGEARVDQFERKAGFELVPNYYALSQNVADEAGIDKSRILNLTDRMQSDGTLDWTPPEGRWRIIRMGWSLLGTTNHPAPMEATGLEVDKYDGKAVRAYIETYLDNYRSATGSALLGKEGVRALLNDSIEVGAANWTPKLIDQFKRLRGYDPSPWLPTLTGVIVGSRAESDRFLFDYRRTLADLMASEHYATIATVAHENDLIVYQESLEGHRATHGDDMTMRSFADVPMAAMWTFSAETGPNPRFTNDIRGAASVAHIYGQNLVAAESMTAFMSPWTFSPKDLRRVIDLEFVAGVNRPVVHTSTHQPVDDKKPGLSLSIFGQYFTRHETWAEMARPWIDYIARSSYLLQQGHNVADVVYFYGEEAPIAGLTEDGQLQDTPARHAYDFANDDVLAKLSVDDRELVAPSGVRYKALYLGGSSSHMSLAALQRLRELAVAGATIIGVAPVSDPGLASDPARYAELVKELWSGQPVTKVGAGQVVANKDVEASLASIGVVPDFDYERSAPDSEVLFIHRRTPEADIYFVSNRRARQEIINAKFRVTGKAAEVWRADTAGIEKVSYRMEGEQTVVPLRFEAEESYFVVLRQPVDAASVEIAPVTFADGVALEGPWTVSFEAGRGAPERIDLAELGSLSDHSDPGVKYFSGVATYAKSFATPEGYKAGEPLRIDLGAVGDLAEIYVNGKLAGTVWHAPWQIDIGAFVVEGTNSLEVRVANVWVNRLIGDAQPGAAKITYTALPTYKPDAPLRPSGLIGPVKLLRLAR